MKNLLLAFSLVAFVSLTGCTSLYASAAYRNDGVQLTDNELSKYVDLHASRDEVIKDIGNPDSRIQLNDGELFEYQFMTNKGLGKGVEYGKIVLEFNVKGLLVKQYRLVDKI